MGESDVGQAGQSRRAAMGAVRGRGGRRFGGSLKGVIFSFGQSGQTPRGSEENSGGGLDVSRRGGGGLPTCSRTCGAGRVHRARQKPAVSSRQRPEEWRTETQAKKHPGARERAQGEDHHDEGAFSTVKVGVSRYGRWWFKVKMQWKDLVRTMSSLVLDTTREIQLSYHMT